MNWDETNKILSAVAQFYPGYLKGRDPKITADVWQTIFSQVPYALVKQAVMGYIASDVKGFPPSPGAINEYIRCLQGEDDEQTESEAWALVVKATRRGIYNSREEFDKLPPDIRRIVGDASQIHEWALMDSEEVNTVIASHFRRAWRAQRERQKMLGYCSLPVPDSSPKLPG